mmetsp:Transcript_8570/g.21560  ORF Transcript_8570/g.21560 Transcript_8570/m.21560 type:complete len:800 (+) Transcript_8570:4060-6459(+)
MLHAGPRGLIEVLVGPAPVQNVVRAELLTVAGGGHRLAERRDAGGSVPGVDARGGVGAEVEGPVAASAADRGGQDLAKDLGVRDTARRMHLGRNEPVGRNGSFWNCGVLGEAPGLRRHTQGRRVAAALAHQRAGHNGELRGRVALRLHELHAHHPLLRSHVPLDEGGSPPGVVHDLGVAVQALTPPVGCRVPVEEPGYASVIRVGVGAADLHAAQSVDVSALLHSGIRPGLLQRHHAHHVARQRRQRVLAGHDLCGAAASIVHHLLGASCVAVHLHLRNPPPIVQAILVLQAEILGTNHLVIEIGLETARGAVAGISILRAASADRRGPGDLRAVRLRRVGVAVLGVPTPSILSGTLVQVLRPHEVRVDPCDSDLEVPGSFRHGDAAALLLDVHELGRVAHWVVAGDAEHAQPRHTRGVDHETERAIFQHGTIRPESLDPDNVRLPVLPMLARPGSVALPKLLRGHRPIPLQRVHHGDDDLVCVVASVHQTKLRGRGVVAEDLAAKMPLLGADQCLHSGLGNQHLRHEVIRPQHRAPHGRIRLRQELRIRHAVLRAPRPAPHVHLLREPGRGQHAGAEGRAVGGVQAHGAQGHGGVHGDGPGVPVRLMEERVRAGESGERVRHLQRISPQQVQARGQLRPPQVGQLVCRIVRAVAEGPRHVGPVIRRLQGGLQPGGRDGRLQPAVRGPLRRGLVRGRGGGLGVGEVRCGAGLLAEGGVDGSVGVEVAHGVGVVVPVGEAEGCVGVRGQQAGAGLADRDDALHGGRGGGCRRAGHTAGVGVLRGADSAHTDSIGVNHQIS